MPLLNILAPQAKGPTLPPMYGGQKSLLKTLQKTLKGGSDINAFLNQGVKSPLLSTVLLPLLDVQRQEFAGQQQGLTDAMRRAGALQSGAYGTGLANLYGQQGVAQGNLIAKTTSDMLSPILQSLNTYRGQTLQSLIEGAKAYPNAMYPPSSGGGGSSAASQKLNYQIYSNRLAKGQGTNYGGTGG